MQTPMPECEACPVYVVRSRGRGNGRLLLANLPPADQRIAGLQADLAKGLGPGNAAEAENFFAVALENQVARVQPVLAGQNGDLDGLEFIEADRRTVFGRQAALDDQPPVREGVATAGPGHEPPKIDGQADRDRRQGQQLAQGEKTVAQAISGQPPDPAAEAMEPIPGQTVMIFLAQQEFAVMIEANVQFLRVGHHAGWSQYWKEWLNTRNCTARKADATKSPNSEK